MEEVTWTIVQFIEDLTVEAIPTSWIQGEYCHWPPYKQEKLKNAIRKCQALNTCWPRHTVKIFRNATFDEYGKARSKARVAEDFSDLNSGTDECTLGKRKRIQKILSSSSSSESADDSFKLPPPPKLSRLSLNVKKNTDKPLISNKPLLTSNQLLEQSMDVITIDNSPTVSKPGISQVGKDTRTERDEENESQAISGSGCCFNREKKILMEIKNQNHMTRGILLDVLKELKDLKNIKQPEEGNSIFIKYKEISFPIGNDEMFVAFEEKLRNEENFIEAVNECAKFGGSNPYNFVKRAMSALIQDIILVKYSWLGRKGKRPIEGSPIAKLLIRAADKCLNSDQKQTEEAIQSYIKRSSERQKTRENKKP